MQSGLAVRTVIALTAILAAIWVLLPTFLGKEYQDTLEKHAEWAAMEEPYEPTEPWPWWVDYLPNRKIQEGLDLQGGIDLTLEVEVKEADLSSVQRDIMSLKKSAEIVKVDIAAVRREKGEPRLLI